MNVNKHNCSNNYRIPQIHYLKLLKTDLKLDEILNYNKFKMPFGKFTPSKTDRIKTPCGKIVQTNTSEGYSGLFWGSVYDSNNNPILEPQEHFYELDNCGYKHWDTICEEISKHCLKYIEPYCGTHSHYQCGFGGDESDGLIDFWTEKPIPEMPDMLFEIDGDKYVMKWHYSAGYDDDSSVSYEDN